MITEPTVVVIGAGGSIPFGFPSGRELVTLVLAQLGRLLVRREWCARLGVNDGEAIAFHEALLHSGQSSVDSFVDGRREYLEIAKKAVASVLVAKESMTRLFERDSRQTPDGRWYEHVFGQLKDRGPENLLANQVTFVTFNYDRSLEAYLLNAVLNSYGMEREEASAIVSRLPVLHVYGDLGDLFDPHGGAYRDYVPRSEPMWIQRACDRLRLVPEERELVGGPGSVPDHILRIRSALQAARRICFLGFGFDPTNLKRIRPASTVDDVAVYGSSYGLTPEERQRQEIALGAWAGNPTVAVRLAAPTADCLTTLRTVAFLS